MENVLPVITLILLVITGICVPITLFMVSRFHVRLDHLDECIDSVRELVLAKGVKREDFLQHRADVAEIVNRQSVTISTAQDGLHQRLMRLEGLFLSGERPVPHS